MEKRIPFYDFETAARLLAELVIAYDLVSVIEDDFIDSGADASIVDTAAHDILAHLESGGASVVRQQE